ncbi:uncharacterized protein LOC133192961 [Saccostrea echinata]|uniref:uncharacterized protein LOC133192961 n=1 Tax=Saccostrea echinata TaxID=191078 RepID=UPI002A7F1425|nr:uncharacterized protein LOC133192961 [Saccostrea echinata]
MTEPFYLSAQWTNDFVVFSERKTWLDARDVCKSIDSVPQYNKWNLLNWYIKTKAIRNGWSGTDDVWLGMIKHQNSDVWNEERKYICQEVTMKISGQNQLERQCAVLNMSSVSPNDNLMIYASSCDKSIFGFVCLVAQGELPKGVEYYPFSEVEEKGDRRLKLNTSSDTECAISSFSIIYCFAATYFPEDKYCVAECTPMVNIPETVTLVNSSTNSTVLLRTFNKVLINYTESTLPPSTDQFPCPLESTAETSTVEIPTGGSTTSLQKLDSTSSLPELPDDTTTSMGQTTTSDDGTKTVTQIQDETTFTDLSKGTITQMSHCSTMEVYSGCLCTSQTGNIETNELNQKVLEIKKILTVNISSLSSTMRKKISAPDDRQSSLAMGTLGICVIVGVILALVVGDMVYIVSCVKYLFCCKRKHIHVQHL